MLTDKFIPQQTPKKNWMGDCGKADIEYICPHKGEAELLCRRRTGGPSLQFEEGIEKTVRWYLENEVWMDNITSGEYEKYYEDMYKGKTV